MAPSVPQARLLVYSRSMRHDIATLRAAIPMLRRRIDGHPLTYLDWAATTQKPEIVLQAMDVFLRTSNANANRGVHVLAEEATVAVEQARTAVQTFIGAADRSNILFTSGTTQGINLVARAWGDVHVRSTDTIVLSALEHHSNIVPWLQLQERTGCSIAWLETDAEGRVDPAALATLCQRASVALVAVTGLSNVLGARTPLQEMIRIAHAAGAVVLVDAAQLAAHATIDVHQLDADFVVFSGHKIYGPTGVGVLYGRGSILQTMPPFLGGGDMVTTVTRTTFRPAPLPRRFEAGTQPIAEIVGLGAAVAWLGSIDRALAAAHERELLLHARELLGSIPGLRLLGPKEPMGCVSFTIEGLHPHDVTDVLGRHGICLRAGHHCAQPLHDALGLPATTRLSVGLVTTHDEIAHAATAIASVVKAHR